MKTPEEIKKGLECCLDDCDQVGNCPYSGTFGCDECLKRDALAYIEKLEPQIPRWIPVEERLPAKSKTVLVVADGMVDIACFSENGWGLYTLECCTITHWMPLPEPPEEAKTNG